MAVDIKKRYCDPWAHVADGQIAKLINSVNGFPVTEAICANCGLKFHRYLRSTDSRYASKAKGTAVIVPSMADAMVEYRPYLAAEIE